MPGRSIPPPPPTPAQSSNLALSRYLIVIIFFIIIGFIALLSERTFFLGSHKVRKQRHLHDHHFGYSADEGEEEATKGNQHHHVVSDGGDHVDGDATSCQIYNSESHTIPKENHLFITDVTDDSDSKKRESEKERERLVDVAIEFANKVTLFVNVASKCGYTKVGYRALDELYSEFSQQQHHASNNKFKKDFEIAAIPSNDFGHQEPGSIDDIRHFARTTFHARFKIYAKTSVVGANAIPLFRKLVRCSPAGRFSNQPVSWNFNFFLVDSDGKVVARFQPGTSADEMRKVIEPLLL